MAFHHNTIEAIELQIDTLRCVLLDGAFSLCAQTTAFLLWSINHTTYQLFDRSIIYYYTLTDDKIQQMLNLI